MWILECGTVSVKRKGWISIEMNDGGTSLKQRKKFTREQSITARFSVLLIYCVLFSLGPFSSTRSLLSWDWGRNRLFSD